jgi:hypothetical protein
VQLFSEGNEAIEDVVPSLFQIVTVPAGVCDGDGGSRGCGCGRGRVVGDEVDGDRFDRTAVDAVFPAPGHDEATPRFHHGELAMHSESGGLARHAVEPAHTGVDDVLGVWEHRPPPVREQVDICPRRVDRAGLSEDMAFEHQRSHVTLLIGYIVNQCRGVLCSIVVDLMAAKGQR